MSKRLLLADDSVVIQKLVGLSFANEDVEILTADNGDDAIALARQAKPDVVIADVIMPGKSGYEVCEAIKQDPGLATIPVLLLTGTFEAFDEGRARDVGSDGHITKPFEAQALVAQIHDLFDRAPVAIAPPVATAATPTPAAPADDAFDFFDDDVSDLSGVGEDNVVPPPAAAAPAPLERTAPADPPDRSDPLAPAPDLPGPSPAGDRGFALMPETHADTDLETDLVSAADPLSLPDASDAAPTVLVDDLFEPPRADSDSDWLEPPSATSVAAATVVEDFGAAMDDMPQAEPARPVDPSETMLAEDLFGDATPAAPAAAAEVADLDFGLDDPFPQAAAPDLRDAIDTTAPAARSVVDPGDSSYDISSSELEPYPVPEAAPSVDEIPVESLPEIEPEPVAPAALPPAQLTNMQGDTNPIADPFSGPDTTDPAPAPQRFGATPAARPAESKEPGFSAPSFTAPIFERPDFGPTRSEEPVVEAAHFAEPEPSAPAAAAPTAQAGTPSAGRQSSTFDVTPLMRERLHETLEKVAWEAFSELSEQVVRQVLERVESIAWEVIPQMTEAMIQEEIRRMKGE